MLSIGALERFILGGGWPPCAGCGADDAFGACLGRSVDHHSIGIDVRENDIHSRQRPHGSYLELGLRRMLSGRLMIIKHLSVGIGEPQGSEIAGFERFDPVRRVFRHVARVENRLVHHDQAPATDGLRVGGDANRVDHIEIAVGTDRR
jgi:hypothetical protein